MKLGHKGWNNVLIFTMLFMSFLFLFVSGRMNDNSEQGPQPLLNQHERLFGLSIDAAQFHKVGLDWRQSSGTQLLSVPVDALVQTWTEVVVTTCNVTPTSPVYHVLLSLVGTQAQVSVDVVSKGDDAPILFVNGRCYQSQNLTLSQLIPEELQ